ncbi:MAG: mercuric transporter MerT family protein [Methylobacter sp.]|nr:mercuric transporter MerT family protein [Methylobacter sp.]
MTREHVTPPKDTSWLGFGAVLAAIGASICCVGPLLLLSLGIGGAWMSALTSMESIRPFFLILSLIFIGFGFRKLYLIPANCKAGEACAAYDVQHRQRLIFWIGSVLIMMLLAFPWYAPLFIE